MDGAAIGEARIQFPEDALAEDNRVGFRPAGGLPVDVVGDPPSPGSPAERLVRALVAAGAEWGSYRQEGGLALVVQDVWEPGPMSTLGPFRTAVRILVDLPAGGEVVKGSGVVGTDHPLARGVQVDPTVTLGPRVATPPTGTPILADEAGPLVTTWEKDRVTFVCFGFLPGGTWVERDPSFVVFAKNLVEYAAGGPARIEATGVLSSAETREAAEGETFGDLRQALEEARRPDPATRTSWAFPLLLAGAALLVAAWLAGR